MTVTSSNPCDVTTFSSPPQLPTQPGVKRGDGEGRRGKCRSQWSESTLLSILVTAGHRYSRNILSRNSSEMRCSNFLGTRVESLCRKLKAEGEKERGGWGTLRGKKVMIYLRKMTLKHWTKTCNLTRTIHSNTFFFFQVWEWSHTHLRGCPLHIPLYFHLITNPLPCVS